MKKFCKAILMSLVCVLSFSLFGCGIKDVSVQGIKDYGKLVVATNSAFPPFEYKEGKKVVGWDMEIAQYFADELGVKLKIIDLEFDGVLVSLDTMKAHVAMAGITANEKRRKSVDFTQNVCDTNQVIIVKTNETRIANNMDLLNKKVGSQRGTVGNFLAEMSEDWAYEFNDDGSVNLNKPLLGKPEKSLPYDNNAIAIQALIDNKIDAVILDEYPAQEFIKVNSGLKILKDSENKNYSLYEDKYAFAVKKGNTELAKKLDELFAKLKNSPRMKEINDKYGVKNA